MSNIKRTLDELEIRDLLTGLTHRGKRYYRVIPETGVHVPVAVRIELEKLDMSAVTATRLLQEAASAGLITEQEERADDKQEGVAAVVADATDDDDDEEPDEFGSRATRKLPLGLSDIPKGELDRYELVKTGSGFWGYYDREHHHEVILSRDKEAVLEEIYALRRNGKLHAVI